MRSVASLWAVLAVLTGPLADVRADEPTFARLSFWVPPERMSEFEATYEERIIPILGKHGFTGSSEEGRATVDSVFSRLLEVETPGAVVAKRQALHKDPMWQEVLRSLGTTFGTTGEEGFIRNRFALYKAPVGAGERVVVGPGLRQGSWQNFTLHDGLPPLRINSITHDREGNLWFGAVSGLCRYDGVHFVTLTTEDGLPDDYVSSIVEDRAGNLWLGTRGGLSRYDGQKFVTFTSEDGLADDFVLSIMEDRTGNLWFGTWGGGVSRYDGQKFVTLTSEDGLATNTVLSIVEDRQGNVWFGTRDGLSRYDGEAFITYTVEDGLADNNVRAIVEDRQGNLWVGTAGFLSDRGQGGVSRYDGQKFVTFTSEDGLADNYVWSLLEDRRGNLWIGTLLGGVSRYDGQKFVTFTTQDGLADNDVRSFGEDPQGNVWVGTDGGGASRYDGEQFATFTTENGLPYNNVRYIVEDGQGKLWASTAGGVSRYDGGQFTTLTSEDGLAHNRVHWMVKGRQGSLWISTSGGVSLYDGIQFTTFTSEDGLASNHAIAIFEDRQGNLWVGMGQHHSEGEGVSRYDGKGFVTFTAEDGLAKNEVRYIGEDRQGNIWVGTAGGGVSRYDGQQFTTFTVDNTGGGLASNNVFSMLEDKRGNLWFSTYGGASRFDGQQFVSFTTEDGLVDNRVFDAMEDRQGNLWFRTAGGASRFDGSQFVSFTTEDGLAGNFLGQILEDRQGHLWFSTPGGVNRYDGLVFQTLSRKDGLVHDEVNRLYEDRHGNIWFVTKNGLTRYQSQPAFPPAIYFTEVVADRLYGSVESLRLPSSQAFVAFEFQGRSMMTRPDGMVYLYRLKGYVDEWRTTRETKVEYTDLPSGNYVFQVKAVDRDLNYSEEPAQLRLTIHPPYGIIGLVGGLGLALVLAMVASGYAISKRRELRRAEHALMLELEEELQTAHNMQMGLMPQKQPGISGFDILGRCLPANHVGGDFFQYFDRPHNRLAVSMADVTGHAMEAAIPVVMFSGILDNQMETGGSLEDLFAKLNRSMHRNLDRRNFVCFAMGELDPATRTFRLSNGGCPFPYHFQAANGNVVELQVEAYPLGVRPDTAYQVVEVQLESGDYIVFCSDGIAEARNAAGELFGFGRTAETVRQGCAEELSATALIDRLIGEVQAFSGDNPQEDDQTIVVVGVES